jgi:hypothetical protein
MEFRLLGPLEVDNGSARVVVSGRKLRALLARLLLDANRTISIDRLMDDLWGAEVPESAHKMVQIYVSQLRKVLPGGMLRTRPPGYAIEVDPARYRRRLPRSPRHYRVRHQQEFRTRTCRCQNICSRPAAPQEPRRRHAGHSDVSEHVPLVGTPVPAPGLSRFRGGGAGREQRRSADGSRRGFRRVCAPRFAGAGRRPRAGAARRRARGSAGSARAGRPA